MSRNPDLPLKHASFGDVAFIHRSVVAAVHETLGHVPEYRKALLALVAMKAYVKLWQNKRFHKIIAFTKTDNRAPQLIMQRSGYQLPILLRQHLFGVDFFDV